MSATDIKNLSTYMKTLVEHVNKSYSVISYLEKNNQ